MEIENKLFKKYKPDYQKLLKYGFQKENNFFIIEKNFKNSDFKAIIKVLPENTVEGKVYDLETNDEFLPLRVESQQGAFVGEVRENYEKILIEIRNNCFYKNYFILAQSNRIADLINKKYNVEPEFLWEKYEDIGIFRNKKSDKWFGIIMDVDKSRIEKGQKGFIEVMNVKLTSDTLSESLKENGFYPAYHMNKKYWITFVLDETLSDSKIMKLVEESYNLVEKKGAVQKAKI